MATIHRWNSQGIGYKQYFEDVCTKKSYMALLNTNQTIGYLWDYILKNEDNLGVSGPGNPLSQIIRFDRTPQDILEETSEISYSDCENSFASGLSRYCETDLLSTVLRTVIGEVVTYGFSDL